MKGFGQLKEYLQRIFQTPQVQQNSSRNQQVFFNSTFAMMGYVAKADGSVSTLEINVAQKIMNTMRLDPRQKKRAISQFEKGKNAGFSMDSTLQLLRIHCSGHSHLINAFLEGLTMVALADGHLLEPQNRILRNTSMSMGYSLKQYQTLLRRMRKNSTETKAKAKSGDKVNKFSPKTNRRKVNLNRKDHIKLMQAYEILNIDEHDDSISIRNSYLKQMNLHHPDKLISKGMSASELKRAGQKIPSISAAYRFVKTYQMLKELQ